VLGNQPSTENETDKAIGIDTPPSRTTADNLSGVTVAIRLVAQLAEPSDDIPHLDGASIAAHRESNYVVPAYAGMIRWCRARHIAVRAEVGWDHDPRIRVTVAW
jgi:hypothetical protein